MVKPAAASAILLLLNACDAQDAIIPGRTFYESNDCGVYEEIRSGFLSSVTVLYINCGKAIEVLWSYRPNLHSVKVQEFNDIVNLKIYYCPIGRMVPTEELIDRMETLSSAMPVHINTTIETGGCQAM